MNSETATRTASEERTRVVVVDDHELARQGLQDMLADEEDIEVVGEASNGSEALLVCSRLLPDMVLMDVRMPRMDGLAATQQLKKQHPRISVLMVTMHENADYLLTALRAGAAGYVLKDAAQHEMVSAIRQVVSGESPLEPQLAARLLRRLATETEKTNLAADERSNERYLDTLTRRELEVLKLMRLGQTNRQIAQQLFISPGTVKNHVEHIISKLGVSDRTQAVVRALEVGLLDLSR